MPKSQSHRLKAPKKTVKKSGTQRQPNSSAAMTAQQNVPTTTFHGFKKLPVELQLMVWDFAIIGEHLQEKRIVLLKPQRVPTLLHATRSSRKAALKHLVTFELKSTIRHEHGLPKQYVYLNPKFDIPYITDFDCDRGLIRREYIERCIDMGFLTFAAPEVRFRSVFNDPQFWLQLHDNYEELDARNPLKKIMIVWDGEKVEDKGDALGMKVVSVGNLSPERSHNTDMMFMLLAATKYLVKLPGQVQLEFRMMSPFKK